MISVTEAKQLIAENCNPGKIQSLPILEAAGSILAESTYSLIDSPPFNQSAMDGYAFSFAGWDGISDLNVKREIQAGNYSTEILKAFEAIRIFTGAALPAGADTVVMQEKVVATGNTISVKDSQLNLGANVRLQGSEVKKGEITLKENHQLTPASISFLAGTGIDRIMVYAKPTVSIIVTGKELVRPGAPISEGMIYESNSFGLIAALKQLTLSPASVQQIDDHQNEIENAITAQLHADILIITGGVSVGAYDYVAGALDTCGVKKIFHKVKQKPGKPFYFGTYNKTMVFALPGNPAAVLTCFYEYVVPAIRSFTKKVYFKELKMSLEKDFKKKPGLTFFLKGKIKNNEVSILDNQESYLMNSFAMADCLIELEEEKEVFEKGDLVSVKMII